MAGNIHVGEHGRGVLAEVARRLERGSAQVGEGARRRNRRIHHEIPGRDSARGTFRGEVIDQTKIVERERRSHVSREVGRGKTEKINLVSWSGVSNIFTRI